MRGKQAERDEICVGTACVFSLRVIRPSLQALRSTRFLRFGERFITAQRDALLEDFWKRVQGTAVHPLHHGSALFDTTAALTTQGIALAGLTPEAFLHYVWASRDHGLAFKGRGATGRGQFPGQLAWQVLHDMGHFPSDIPAAKRSPSTAGPINGSGPPPTTDAPGGADRPTPGSAIWEMARTSMSPLPRISPSGSSPRWRSSATRAFVSTSFWNSPT